MENTYPNRAVNGATAANLNSPNTLWAVLLAIIIFIIVVFIFQIAWNSTMPHIFGIRKIDWVQALLLIIVARVIFPSTASVLMLPGGTWGTTATI